MEDWSLKHGCVGSRLLRLRTRLLGPDFKCDRNCHRRQRQAEQRYGGQGQQNGVPHGGAGERRFVAEKLVEPERSEQEQRDLGQESESKERTHDLTSFIAIRRNIL
jgi:hypothetical protein